MSRFPANLLALAGALLLSACSRTPEAPQPSGEAVEGQRPAASRESALPTVPDGQARIEIELLRAPVQNVAESLLGLDDNDTHDAEFRDRLLAAGATVVLNCSAAGACGEQLKDRKVKLTKDYPLFAWASLWQQQAYELENGLPLSKIEDEEDGSEAAEGYTLEARLDSIEEGTLAEIGLEWSAPLVVRPVNSWPVQGGGPHILQSRVWTLQTRRTLPANRRCLLAISPEPPSAESTDNGFVYVAFGRITANPGTDEPAGISQPRTLQCWTFEMPADEARRQLASRGDPAADEKILLSLLRLRDPQSACRIVNATMLRSDLCGVVTGGTDLVDSRVAWNEPIGFEPSTERGMRFIPVPNDTNSVSVTHRLVATGLMAKMSLPAGDVKWVRWHGSTRGAKDEPVGVESSAVGASEYSFYQRSPGRVFLANAHSWGSRVRLTFARGFFPSKAEQPTSSYSIQVVETPPEPWMPRLAKGQDSATLIPELSAALQNGGATLLHTEVATLAEFSRFGRDDTWPWMAIATDYLSPNIQPGRFCYNPRSITHSTPACRMEAERDGNFYASLCGQPVSRRHGLWLTDVAGFGPESSTISLTEWPQLNLMSPAVLPMDRPLLLHVSLGRSCAQPEQPAVHWVLFEGKNFPGAPPPTEPDPAGVPDLVDSSPAPPPAPPPMATFTITDAAGTVLAYAALPAKGSSLSDGYTIQSLDPRSKNTSSSFQEPESETPSATPQPLSGAIGVATTLDGLEVKIEADGKWTLEHSLAPARKITETFIATTETAPDSRTEPVKVNVSCERLVLRREKVSGTLPATGSTCTENLPQNRVLTVTVRK